MPGASRRNFLKSGSIGAVAVGAALTPGLLAGSAETASPAAKGPLPEGPVTVYVKDHTTGELAVMVGEREVVYRDRQLAARIARIATHA